MKKFFKVLLIVLAALIVLIGVFLLYLTLSEYRPADVEAISVEGQSETNIDKSDTINIVSWNIGYCGLGAEESFVLDGGSGSGRPKSKETMLSYYQGVSDTLRDLDADIYILQEVDSDSSRSYGYNEVSSLQNDLMSAQSAYALNYSCSFVPFPWPPMGKVHSGVLTLTDCSIRQAERVSLPCPFSWPLRTANLKRCLLISRIPLEGSDKELVLVNLHLEAYDDGEGKAAQTAMLLEILEEEYAEGNYVIAGGDFNQSFEGSLDAWPIVDAQLWTPGVLNSADLPNGWQFAYDNTTPSCRLLNQAYDASDAATQYYVIDGFILSPNVELVLAETIDAGFAYSDHNPVRLQIKLS